DFCADLARRFDAVLLGALGSPQIPDNRHIRDILLGMRVGLDLYINLRPVQLLDERLCPIKGKRLADVDFLVYRENTEGAYSGLGAALVGGLALAPSATVHPGRCSMFEPVHGSAPDIAGKDRANPFAAILAAALLLEHLGAPGAARRIEEAVTGCVRAGKTTPD